MCFGYVSSHLCLYSIFLAEELRSGMMMANGALPVTDSSIYPAKIEDCPNGCPTGSMAIRRGGRKNQLLLNVGEHPYRWVANCTGCSGKWHACRFGCNHLQKINKQGNGTPSIRLLPITDDLTPLQGLLTR